MIDTTIVLISPTRTQGADGVWRTGAEARREVFARMDSIDRGEFFAAGQNGLRPEHRFTVCAVEYEGEEACEWNGERFAIYRSYHVPGTDDMELYVQRKAGVSGGA